MAGQHVGNFMADDRRQGIGILGDAEEPGVDANVAPGQGKGVHVVALEHPHLPVAPYLGR